MTCAMVAHHAVLRLPQFNAIIRANRIRDVMAVSLTFNSMAALFAAMVLLALVPGVSVLAVTARAAASGFRRGVYVTLGIIAGDTVFIALAMLGLHLLAAALDDAFVFIRFLGGAWLVWLGIRMWCPAAAVAAKQDAAGRPALSDFMSGLLITLGDQKAVLFYLGFFPAFVDLAALSPIDTLLVIAIATVAVGSVKLGYAWVASRAGGAMDPRPGRLMHRVAGGLLLAVGLYVIVMA